MENTYGMALFEASRPSIRRSSKEHHTTTRQKICRNTLMVMNALPTLYELHCCPLSYKSVSIFLNKIIRVFSQPARHSLQQPIRGQETHRNDTFSQTKISECEVPIE